MAKISLSPGAGTLTAKACALMYAALGWSVFPVYEFSGGKCSCAEGGECARPGKHPRTPNGHEDASADRNTIEAWWTRWPAANIGVATGRRSGLTVVDADAGGGKPGVINLTTLCAPHGGVPATLIAASGGGGLHLYFKYTERLATGANVLAEAVDVRNDGGYIIAPPSTHASGGVYAWRAREGELLEVPEWLAVPEVREARRRGRPRSRGGYRLEKAASMLAAVDAEDRDRWLAVGVILGRLYVGSGQETDAWAVYEAWSAKATKFDEDRTGNILRMREMFYDRSQEEPRTGGAPLGIGTLITWAKAAGWSPFGERKLVDYEPGNEFAMAEALVEALTTLPENRHFNVMGSVRDVIRAPIPSALNIKIARRTGTKLQDTLIVRTTTHATLLAAMTREVAMRTTDKSGAPVAVAIPLGLAMIALSELTAAFPPLAGLTQWPLVDPESGELIVRPTGYDERTGLYFEIDSRLKIDEEMDADAAWKMLREELLVDFPFEDKTAEAAALGMMLAMMQRQFMATCPGWAVVAPQPGSGKSTLVEVAALVVHGESLPTQAWSLDSEELRKALHSILISKAPAVLFDNITRGASIDSDHLAKLITSERSSDRVLGSSEIRSEMNTLLVVFTGNNISFARDLATRVITIKMNARRAAPLQRRFTHKDILKFTLKHRSRWLSALVAIARAGIGYEFEGEGGSRFPAFDECVAGAVMRVTGEDVRTLLMEEESAESEEEEAQRGMLEMLWRWQERWRGVEENSRAWRIGDLTSAIEGRTFGERDLAVLQRGASGDPRAWERDPARAIGFALRALNGNYRFAPMVMNSVLDKNKKVNRWIIKGGPALPTLQEQGPTPV